MFDTPTPNTPVTSEAETGPFSVTIASDPEIESGIRTVMAALPLATRHAVARAALRAGVRALVKEKCFSLCHRSY